MLSEVREPEASKLVKYTGLGGYVDSYENYQNEGYLFLPTALESLESAILAEGWYFENPYLNPKNLKVDKNNPPFCLSDWYEQKLLEYETAESRVLDRSRCLLLGREG